MAARAGVRESIVDPNSYVATNVGGILNVLGVCRRWQIPKFILASSSSVYGGETKVPFCEGTETDWIWVIFVLSSVPIEGRPVILNGDGKQRRDFTQVDEIARGFAAALRLVGYRIFNLGSNAPVGLRDLIGLMEEFMGRSACIATRPSHSADMNTTWADVSRAASELD